VLYSFDAGETSGLFITNKHPNGYRAVLVSSGSSGILGFQPLYCINEWSSGGQEVVGSFHHNNDHVEFLECDEGTKITGFSGKVEANYGQYPIIGFKAYCNCK
jgi:phospholipase C